MSYGGVDVRFFRETKGMSLDALLLFVAVRLYCAERETDGHFSRGYLLACAEEAGITSDPMKLAAAWVTHGAWEKTSEGWHDIHYLNDNPTHATREKYRQKSAKQRAKLGGGR